MSLIHEVPYHIILASIYHIPYLLVGEYLKYYGNGTFPEWDSRHQCLIAIYQVYFINQNHHPV